MQTLTESPSAKKNTNQFWLIYCRENARESRFGNLRGKICPKFAHIYNCLTVSLLIENTSLSPTKCMC